VFAVFVGRVFLTTLSSFSRLHAGIITSFKLINIPEAAHNQVLFSSRPNVKEEKVWLREIIKHQCPSMGAARAGS